MQLGFVIDQSRCIGCHACTVACKAENNVPVGDFRTWVKYVEKGSFPAVRRHFAVFRCNHCTNAPCVAICPVNALEKRTDGVVDIDRDACIGCRACMQACPYDAIYLDEDTGAIGKCHFCAHKTEKKLAPACVSVCPEEAILYGDIHDPDSRVGKLARSGKTTVRRPEQNTGPNVHYIEAEPLVLQPGAAVQAPGFLWSQRAPWRPEAWPSALPVAPNALVAYEPVHKVPWGPAVAIFLVVKGTAAGAAMLAPFVPLKPAFGPELLVLVFTTIATALLIEDLARPKLFLRLLLRPNKKSWLVRGAWVLMSFSAVEGLGFGARLLGIPAMADPLRWAGAVLGLAVAGYSAGLFAMCEGRDLWQSRLTLPRLLCQALSVGGAALIGLGATSLIPEVVTALLAFLSLSAAERYLPHKTENASQAAAFLREFRVRGVPPLAAVAVAALGTVVLGLTVPAFVPALVIAAVALEEHAWLRCGQLPPNS